jgi:hypothetical protein
VRAVSDFCLESLKLVRIRSKELVHVPRPKLFSVKLSCPAKLTIPW